MRRVLTAAAVMTWIAVSVVVLTGRREHSAREPGAEERAGLSDGAGLVVTGAG